MILTSTETEISFSIQTRPLYTILTLILTEEGIRFSYGEKVGEYTIDIPIQQKQYALMAIQRWSVAIKDIQISVDVAKQLQIV